jgi:hypothetical protein
VRFQSALLEGVTRCLAEIAYFQCGGAGRSGIGDPKREDDVASISLRPHLLPLKGYIGEGEENDHDG